VCREFDSLQGHNSFQISDCRFRIADFGSRQLHELSEEKEIDDPRAISKRHVPAGVKVFEIYGSLFFAAVDQFKDALRRVEKNPKVLILRMYWFWTQQD
jgi:MFS superfamily sulfate permease-like transporter